MAEKIRAEVFANYSNGTHILT